MGNDQKAGNLGTTTPQSGGSVVNTRAPWADVGADAAGESSEQSDVGADAAGSSSVGAAETSGVPEALGVTEVPVVSEAPEPTPRVTSGVPDAGPKAGVSPSGQENPAQAAELTKKKEGVKKRREIIKARDDGSATARRLGDLIVPLLSLIVLVLIVIFVFIPFSSEISETKANIASLANEIERNNLKISTLNSVDLASLESSLRVVSIVVKDDMDVSELAEEVEQIALENDLTPKELSMSNSGGLVLEPSEAEESGWKPQYARTISGPFSFYGEFEDVTGFLDELRSNGYTILSLGAIHLRRYYAGEEEMAEGGSSGAVLWSVDIVIDGYTVDQITETVLSEPIYVYSDEELLDDLYVRAGKKDAGASESEAGSGESGDTEFGGTDEGGNEAETDTDTDTDTVTGTSQ